jgi:poly(A) polymerase
MTGGLDEKALAGLLDRPSLRHLLHVLNRDGEETRIIGGAVRNALIGRPVTDIDCATTATPKSVTDLAERAGFKVVPTGIDHGTVTVIVHGEPFEITTLREDVETDGRRAVVRFGRDFVADAQRRDFTINALSFGIDRRVHDYTDGLADLEAGRVRFIGDPATRIREDYLRILRFFRFYADYASGDPDPSGLKASVTACAGLATLSHERIRAEMLKLLSARRAVHATAILAEYGFLARLLAGAAELGRLSRVAAFEASERMRPDPVRRLAALSVTTGEDAERLRERLRLSNGEHARLIAYATLLVALKTRPLPVDAGAIRRLVAEFGLGPVVDVLAAVAGEPQPILAEGWREAFDRFRTGVEPLPAFPLRGADLVAAGIPAGPRIGEILAQARQAWLAAGCPSDESFRSWILERILAGEHQP